MSVQTFISWWNNLALRNGKIKFRNRREAAEFVRSLSNARGISEEMKEMRQDYEAARKAQEAKKDARSLGGVSTLLFQSEDRV